ncbi:PREDICTED: mini-chromosome maintenance complex-binding protein isoform X2 [Acromyrmex echinatior]|uniref:mini-chromosome maintenance complex-binding protein isoform X2 n=1 Tax=Acromyrmex echinatior TaxID=103372 RepID=UPI000580FFF0|nr:PREDICTED: mini-chromosome maintenance complex-binding protein isoform X2 [Acromyrmex echinatior]
MTSVEIRDWTPEYYVSNQLNCQKILESRNILTKIPLLNNTQLHDIKDKELVRFRGMIQDMYDPEYYLKQYEVKNTSTGESNIRCGMYMDAAQCLPHEMVLLYSKNNQTSGRQTYVVISIPGLNDWAKEESMAIQTPRTTTHNDSTNKRSLDENDLEEMDYSEPVTKKEKVSADNNDVNMTDAEGSAKVQSVLSEDHILNFPIPIDGGKTCIVKIYNDTVLKLNQVIDIIGFISLDPSLSIIQSSDDEMNEAEIQTHNPPASLVPRLHAVKIIELTKPIIINAPEILSKAQLIRGDLHIILSQLLFGDTLAADYMICHLLSMMYLRKESFSLFTFPLNITNIPVNKHKTFPKEFYNFLKLFVKKSYFLEITLENLNELALIPKKDYECNRLTSGILQLSDNTHLILDETGLNPGTLTATGRENYQALSDLLMFQKLKYDFQFYTIEYETDIPILIFSDAKSFVPCPTQVVLNVDAETENLYSQVTEAAHQYLKDDNRLVNIRQYIETLKYTRPFNLTEGMAKIIQKDFVKLLGEHRNHITKDDLNAMVIFAKVMALSCGQTTLDIDCWKNVVQLENERMSRLSQRRS